WPRWRTRPAPPHNRYTPASTATRHARWHPTRPSWPRGPPSWAVDPTSSTAPHPTTHANTGGPPPRPSHTRRPKTSPSWPRYSAATPHADKPADSRPGTDTGAHPVAPGTLLVRVPGAPGTRVETCYVAGRPLLGRPVRIRSVSTRRPLALPF